MTNHENRMESLDVPINSVKRSYDIINTLFNKKGANITEIADSLEIAKSSTHNHLKTLEKLGIVVQDQDQYHLSLKFYHMGRKERDSYSLYKFTLEELNNIDVREDCYIYSMIEENGVGIMIYDSGWDQSDYIEVKPKTPNISGCYYLHTNALGKSMLSTMSDRQISTIINRYGLPSRTSKTITKRSELKEEILQIKDQGYAFDHGEFVEGIGGLGVPITHDGTTYGSIGIYGLDVDASSDNELVNQIQQRAEAIRANIVYAEE